LPHPSAEGIRGGGSLSDFQFPKVPLQGAPHRGALLADARTRRLALGKSQHHASTVFYISSFATRWTVPVPMASDLATFKIHTPFASCCRTFRSVALSVFGRGGDRCQKVTLSDFKSSDGGSLDSDLSRGHTVPTSRVGGLLGTGARTWKLPNQFELGI
jgi:hypothetical protein